MRAPFHAIVRDCGGFTDVCDSTGTEDILPINVLCLSTATGNVCTAIAGQNQQTIACTVPTDGKACSTGWGGSFCAPYPSECAVQTNLVQDCFSDASASRALRRRPAVGALASGAAGDLGRALSRPTGDILSECFTAYLAS